MSDTVILTLTELESGEEIILDKCLSFRFEQERYTPYTTFRGEFILPRDFGNISSVALNVNGNDIHKGPVDTLKISHTADGNTVTVTSRGYTAALGQNEVQPGVISDLSLGTLLGAEVEIPNITWEITLKSVNYLYVVSHTSVWDVAVNLCLKLGGDYPYITHPNHLRYSMPTETLLVAPYDDGNVIDFGTELNYRNLLSEINMADTKDDPTAFSFTNNKAVALGIKREKFLSLDKRWLECETESLFYRSYYSMRGYNSSYVTYLGYCGEDINDRLRLESGEEKRISRILVTGNKNGVTTKLWCYKDMFNNL